MYRKASPGSRCRQCLIVIAAFCFVAVGAAATLTVSNLNDTGAGSLRQAIRDATTNDTINFSVTGTITLTNGQLLITRNLSINGPGATNLAISGNFASRVLQIGPDAMVALMGMTIRDGKTTNGFGESG